ncbi:hypothetical protein SLS58_004352 [Diplodia intermedia]|uniref:Uncharacterized protein n=1 Tax=Diplodia intermedia TaxID=856260 RepID=A0ABR3TUJ2_9PEZI
MTDQNRALLRFTKSLLGSLCDTQLFTSIAIVISAFAQWPGLSFYHDQFVVQYWFLALNSFLASRRESELGRLRNKDREPKQPANRDQTQTQGFWKMNFWREETFNSWLRRLMVFFSAALFAVFYGLVNRTSYDEWDVFTSGFCYNQNDKSAEGSEWFWLAGVALYALAMLITLWAPANEVLSDWSERAEGLVDHWLRSSIQLISSTHSEAWPSLRGSRCLNFVFIGARYIGFLVLNTTRILGALVSWTIIQFVSIWSFGDGLYALEVAFYFGMWAWGVYDIVDLKQSNKHLLATNEDTWSFGQVLPVILIGTVGLNIMTAYRGLCHEINPNHQVNN